MKKKMIIIAGLVLLPLLASAQTVQTSSNSITAGTWAVHVPYNISDTGTEFNFEIGRGGWGWDFFSYQVRNYHKRISKTGYGIARIGFTGRWSSSNSALSSDQTAALDTELSYVEITGVTKVFLLCGIGNDGNQVGNAGGTPTWNTTLRNNYVADCVRAANYVISKGYTIYAVAPFNEPDFETTYTGNASNYNAVAQLMQQQSVFAGKVYGPSTLNSTQAGTWYNTIKNNINFANTHQLAGTNFTDWTNFWNTAHNDGKTPIADEMHNVMEAMVCANYGGSAGTWWGFNGVTRGEYAVALANGKQLAYKERPSQWMTASVMKYNADGKVKAFLGSSERQGVATAFTFQSRDRLAYYDGVGPVYDYTQDMPGGASGSYQNGQTNAERLVNIDYGESVPIEPINGRYKIVNKASGKVLSLTNGNAATRESVYQWADGGLNNQTWDVLPCPTSHSDFSYVYIRNANTSTMNLYLDAQAWNMNPGANASVWSDSDTADPNDWQYWHLTHIADGYYTITNFLTGMYLEVAGASSANGANVQEWEYNGNDCQLWKFVPADHAVDQTAPSVPTGLTATPQSGSIKLTWTANTDADIYRYMVYRYNTAAGIWECIGRKVQGTSFIDNTCRKNQQLRYRIRALDKSYNLSQPSTEVTASLTTDHAMVARWNGNNLNDATKNKLHAVQSPAGVSLTSNGTHQSFQFNGSTGYLELPYYVGDFQEMSFATWVRPSSTTAWQRIFDFGNGEDSYLFLTPTNGSRMRFEIKANGTTQGLNATQALSSNTWYHVAVTIGASAVKIYINGTQNASATDITLRPSDVAPALCYLGRSMFDADPAFNGMLSDVRIYNYELTASEVAALADITDNTSTGYDITAERLPAIADDVTNWDTHSGYWATYNTNENATDMTIPYCRTSRAGTSTLSKTLNYLPNGTYQLTANAYAYYNGTRNNQQLFMNTATQTINSTRNRTGTLRTLNGTVSDNTLSFGYCTTSSSSATNLAIDNVKIVYQGTASEFAEGLENITYDIIGDAESLLNMPMNKDVKAALQAAVTNVTNALNAYTSAVTGGTATKAIADTWIYALDALDNSGTVVTNAQNSAIAYATLKDAIDAAKAKATAHPQTTAGALTTFNSEIGDVEADYNAGNYTDAQIPEAVIETKRIANSYVMADAVENARETNAINVTALVVDNPTFTSDSYVGWTASPEPGMGYDSAEFYNTNFNMYQVLYGLPAGTYRFETHGFYRYGGQPENYTAYNNGTLQRNAKLYIIDADGTTTVTGDVMAISDDPTPYHEWGNWSSQTYNGYQVPDNMQAASEAIDVRGRYVPANGYNSVTLSYSEGGDITVGARKDVAVGADWSFFGDFSLYYLGNYVTLNETAAALPTLPSGVRSTTFNIDMTRTIVSNDNASSNNAWNTICFPFALSRTQIEDAFGEDAVVKELASVTTNGGSASLYFAEVTAIEANKPYIMKTDQAGSNYIFKGIGYTPSENPAVTVDGVQFVGNYAYPTFLANTNGNDYYILNDEFKHSSGKTKIKGFRAYFHVPASSGIKSLGFHDDEATAIEEMNNEQLTINNSPIYDLSGRRVSRPSRGLYIVDGKKVLLK